MRGVVCAHVGHRIWELVRPGDLETLWAQFPEDDPTAEDRIPYWVELWPAAVALAHFLLDHDVEGQRCLDVGCGLGLPSLVAASRGAHVWGMDLIWEALVYAQGSARRNGVMPSPAWVAMDWNQPAFRPGVFSRIWGADVLYETRFFPALEGMLRSLLAPQGRVWLADPDRAVSRPVWDRFRAAGWTVLCLQEQQWPWYGGPSLVRVWELQPMGGV